MTKTYYEILGIDPNADSKAIRQAYLRASLKHHPDKNPDNVEESKALFIEVGQAYEVLSDPVLRAKYDREIRTGARPTYTGQRASATERGNTEQREYDSYRDAFDAHVAGMSEADIRAAMGLAAVVGSVLGSIIGSRMGAKGGSMMSSVGSLAGSMMASQAASEAVLSLHQQSKDRLANEDARRASVERGEEVPAQEVPLAQKWKEKAKQTYESMKEKQSQRSSEQNRDEASYSQRSNQQNGEEASRKPSWKDGFNKAVASAQEKAAMAAMKHAFSQSSKNS
jgi:curved DNA-binding protein CbpA